MTTRKNNRVEKGFKVKADDKLNPELKKEIQGVRGLIWGNLPEINPRFELAQDPNGPRIYIQDTETGSISPAIGLCNIRGAIEALNWITNFNHT